MVNIHVWPIGKVERVPCRVVVSVSVTDIGAEFPVIPKLVLEHTRTNLHSPVIVAVSERGIFHLETLGAIHIHLR